MQKHIRLLLTLLSLISLFAAPAWAQGDIEPILNKVSLQLQAEQWVTTTTALVDVAVNMTASSADLDKTQAAVLEKLHALASEGEWHIISYDRQEDQSGLEAISMVAQARLPQSVLPKLRDRTKSQSTPGLKVTLTNIQFVPSEDEMRLADSSMRAKIYTQVIAEIDALNKKYPDQKFYMHQINFMQVMPVAMAMNKMMREDVAASAPKTMQVGTKQSMQASVVLAAWPDQITQKITRNII